MKALTLTQPWVTLVAIGAKRAEPFWNALTGNGAAPVPARDALGLWEWTP